MKHETSPDSRSQNASAVDALQEARAMPPGGQRTDALKKVCLLRHVADSHELMVMKKRKAGSSWSQSKLSLPRLKRDEVTLNRFGIPKSRRF